jgi:hypothetical protein
MNREENPHRFLPPQFAKVVQSCFIVVVPKKRIISFAMQIMVKNAVKLPKLMPVTTMTSICCGQS